VHNIILLSIDLPDLQGIKVNDPDRFIPLIYILMYIIVIINELDNSVRLLHLDGLDGVFGGLDGEEHRFAHEGRAGGGQFGGGNLWRNELLTWVRGVNGAIWGIILGLYLSLSYYKLYYFYYSNFFIIYTAFSKTI